jgi:hypothetical protein
MKLKSILLTAVATISFATETMAQVPNYVPTNGLVGWWPFNGNANDESGTGNNGTVNGATLTTDRFGNLNKAYFFDGIDDFIEILFHSSLNSSNGSISAWIKSNGILTNNQNLIYGQGQGRPTICVNSNNNHKARLQWHQQLSGNPSGWAMVTSSSNVDNSQWQQIVGVYDTQNLKIFINGVLEATYSSPLNQWNCSQYNYHIGAFNATSIACGGSLGISQAFNGIIDDIGAWNRALTQQEITDLYNGNICYQTITVTDTLLINMGITGFNPVTYNNTIKIFPNPTNDHITIDYGNFISLSGYQLKIINSLSQQVYQTNITQQSNYLNLTTWGGNGLYFIQIIDPQGNIIDIRKIVLQ